MRTARALWRLVRSVLHVLRGLAIVLWRFPGLDAAGRHECIRKWSVGLLHSVGMELRVTGTPQQGATLVVANHVSWIDIAAIHTAVPQARFVSKADVLRWPLLGRLISGAGTLFIERERKRDAVRVVHAMAEALRAGDTVAIFPEGTTGTGPELLPFHANLLQAAVATGTPVQPVVLRYADTVRRCSDVVVYQGTTTLLQSIWRVVSGSGLCVHVDVLPAVSARPGDRRALALELREAMAERLRA